MSGIVNLYINKVNKFHDSAYYLAKFEEDKNNDFRPLTDFRKYIAKNTEMIKQFKNISGDICQMIDSKNFDLQIIFQLKEIKDLTVQVKENINNVKQLFANVQVTEFENLIDDCFQNMTFETIGNYETKLGNANKQLQEFIAQLKSVNDLKNQSIGKINDIKQSYANVQVTEFEKLIEDCFENITFETVGRYKTKLADANSRLREFIAQLKSVNDLKSQSIGKINDIKQFYANVQVTEFEKLIEDCFENMTFETIDKYKTKLEDANKNLQQIHIELDEETEKAAKKAKEVAIAKSAVIITKIVHENQGWYSKFLRRINRRKLNKEGEKRLNSLIENNASQYNIELIRVMHDLCSHCGGTFNFWRNMCKKCGEPKDY